MARVTLTSIRAELETLYRATGTMITIERSDKDGTIIDNGRFTVTIVPSGIGTAGYISATMTEARDAIRQYLAQTGIIPSTDTFPRDNVVAAIAAHHRSFVTHPVTSNAGPSLPMCDVCNAETADATEITAPGTNGETITLCPECQTRETIVNGATLDTSEPVYGPFHPFDLELQNARVEAAMAACYDDRSITHWELVCIMDDSSSACRLIADIETDRRIDAENAELNAQWSALSPVDRAAYRLSPIPAIGGGSHEADTATGLDFFASLPMPAIEDETTAELLNGRSSHCFDIITDTVIGYDASYRQEKANELRAIVAELVKRGAITGTPAIIADALKPYDPMPEPPAPEADRTATIPAIGGGSHEADTEVAEAAARNRQREASNAQKMTLESAQDAALEVGAMFGKTVRVYRALKDGTPKSDGGWYRFEIDNAQRSAGYRNLSRLLDGLRDTVKTWQETQPTPERVPAPAQPKQPRNTATSQKRDNQRAQRAAMNEAYKAHAAGIASEVSDILTAFGFAIISTKDVDGTPVTIWRDTNPQEIEGTNPNHIAHATIKQTPYSLRIYNGQPARLPRHGDAELINRVEHGWCIGPVEPRGYAAGLADAILRLIEVPDPLMEAIDAMEAREAEQSAPTLKESATIIAFNLRTQEKRTYVTSQSPREIVIAAHAQSTGDNNTWDYETRYGAMVLESDCAFYCGDCGVYKDARFLGETRISAQPDPEPLPELVLIGGQPSMSGPWDVPAISGGSQNAETLSCADCGITSDDTTIERGIFGDLAPRCSSCMSVYIAYVDRLNEAAECPHDQHDTGARFCSQCGHDASPDAPQPTDTGTSHDVPAIAPADVTIEHTPEGGTIVTGTTKAHAATLKACGLKWSRMLTAWYVPLSRDKRPDMHKITRIADALRQAGVSVALDIDDSAADPATVEANRAERLADRHAALHRKAEKLDAESTAQWEKSNQIGKRFEMGQPILVDHYSAKKAYKDQERMHTAMGKSVQAARDAEDTERRANAGERRQAKRMTAPATMRRIEKLETERRDLERRAARGQVGTIGGPTIAERLSDNAEHLAYWRAHLASLEAQGVKVWRPEDFTKGDVVLDQFGLVTVNRVNKKSLSVTTHYTFDHGREWSKTITFDDIKGKATPEQAERFRTA